MLQLNKLRCLCLSFFFGALFSLVLPYEAVQAAGSDCVVLKSTSKKSPGSKTSTKSAAKSTSRKTASSSASSKKTTKSSTRYSKVTSSSSLSRQITAKSAFIMDAETGEVLFAQAPDATRQPASTIKVLTGLIAIDSLKQQDRVKASQNAAAMPRSKIYLRPGKAYAANDMINAVLLASANDASVALAEKIGGTERDFAKLMTAKAESLGARKTVCKTASGLTAPGQHSTARDLALIFNGAMKEPDFSRRMSLRKVETNYGGTLHSHNRALWQVHGAEGGKTGYTNVARKTYVGKFSRGNDQIVVALMGSEAMWTDVKHLVEYGFHQKGKNGSLASAVRLNQPAYKPRRMGSDSLSALTILADTKKVSPM